MTDRNAEQAAGKTDIDFPYARVNLFIGKYRIPGTGFIPLPNAKVRILRGRVADMGWVQDDKGDPWLIVEDGDFWPVMIHLEEGDYPKADL